MTPDIFFTRIVDPTLDWMSAAANVGIPATDSARVLLMAIAGQESGWAARRQIGGPARSYWQFEKAGGVDDIFRATPRQLAAICASLDIACERAVVFEAMAWNDTLACAMARLLLWSDPAPLPVTGDKDAAWACYIRNWRPGAARPSSWDARYDQAVAATKRLR